ncbi:hypothetical protein [Reyranella sp.]|uniref:hypothetical protein n=1 Tax=Reyranella sp. TaxID=1929291 RepID=UPI003783EDDD
MTPRESVLQRIQEGDIFHAEADWGGSLICLALEVTDTTILGKTVTTQLFYLFERRSRVAHDEDGQAFASIDSTARLPDDILGMVMQIDRKFSRVDGGEGFYRLTADEKRALLFIASFYPANPI